MDYRKIQKKNIVSFLQNHTAFTSFLEICASEKPIYCGNCDELYVLYVFNPLVVQLRTYLHTCFEKYNDYFDLSEHFVSCLFTN